MANRTATVCPASTDPDLAEIRVIIEEHRNRPGAMLPMLQAIQGHLGWVPGRAVPLVADAVNCSRAEVQGVLDFYPDFRQAPAGRHVLQICRAESCQAMGSEALEAHAKASLGLDFHQTSPDGTLTLEPVYCLGNCACSPALRLDGEVYGRMDQTGFDVLIDGLGTKGSEIKGVPV
jgi:formate dehydrogenase subunit gamma